MSTRGTLNARETMRVLILFLFLVLGLSFLPTVIAPPAIDPCMGAGAGGWNDPLDAEASLGYKTVAYNNGAPEFYGGPEFNDCARNCTATMHCIHCDLDSTYFCGLQTGLW